MAKQFCRRHIMIKRPVNPHPHPVQRPPTPPNPPTPPFTPPGETLRPHPMPVRPSHPQTPPFRPPGMHPPHHPPHPPTPPLRPIIPPRPPMPPPRPPVPPFHPPIPPRPPVPPPPPIIPPQHGVMWDHGPGPYVVDISRAARQNNNYRQALWTGQHLQLTLMTIRPGDDIGLEIHPSDDQFLCIVEGQGIAQMGPSRRNLNFRQPVFANAAVFVPVGTWHNVTNTGRTPMRLYSIYAPPHHPRGTVHHTKEIAERMGD